MKTISSRFAPIAYVGIITMLTIMLGLAVMVALFVKDDLDKGVPFLETLFWVEGLVVGLMIFIVYTMIKVMQRVTLSDVGVTISSLAESRTFKWDELCEIETTGKRPINGDYLETIKFTPNEGSRVFIPHDNICNIEQICQAIEYIKSQIGRGEQPSLDLFRYEAERPIKGEVDDRRAVRYGKGHIVSLYGAAMVLFSIFAMIFISLFIEYLHTSSFAYLFSVAYFVPMMFMVVMAVIWGMFYFELSDTHLVVRNPMLPLYKRTYLLADILATDSEQHFRQPKSLRVITRRYGSTLFHASTLSSTEWREMFADLRRRGVDTRRN